jgi:molybdopterin-guanine dinucleotide biosynthesis protein A
MLAAVSKRAREPIGIVLAGGLGRRLGGSKAQAQLGGRPLISYPVDVLRSVLSEVRIVAKPGTQLPELQGVEVWAEPAEPRHPLVGIVHALRMADPRPVLVCAGDMPFLAPGVINRLLAVERGTAPAVVAARGGAIEPLLGCYGSDAAALLQTAAREARVPLRAAVAAIGPRIMDLGADTAEVLFNVNTAEDLRRAEARLGVG